MKDALGSTMGLVGAHANAESEFYLYDAYGQPQATSEVGNPYHWTGRRLDMFDGTPFFQYNRHRYYDYNTGRLMSVDPLGVVPNGFRENDELDQQKNVLHGLNLYEYAKSSPVNIYDPYGLKPCGVTLNKDAVKNEIMGIIDKPIHYWLGGAGLWDFGPDIADIQATYGNDDYFSCGLFRPCNGEANWGNNAYAGKLGNSQNKALKERVHGSLQRGKHKSVKCNCVTCPMIYDCLDAVRKEWNNTPYDHWFRNCHTFAYDAMKKCCLKK